MVDTILTDRHAPSMTAVPASLWVSWMHENMIGNVLCSAPHNLQPLSATNSALKYEHLRVRVCGECIWEASWYQRDVNDKEDTSRQPSQVATSRLYEWHYWRNYLIASWLMVSTSSSYSKLCKHEANYNIPLQVCAPLQASVVHHCKLVFVL